MGVNNRHVDKNGHPNKQIIILLMNIHKLLFEMCAVCRCHFSMAICISLTTVNFQRKMLLNVHTLESNCYMFALLLCGVCVYMCVCCVCICVCV